MTRRLLAAIAMISILGSGPLAFAQDSSQDRAWADVMKLPKGLHVEVVVHNTRTIRGRFVHATDSAVTVSEERTERTIKRADVDQVQASPRNNSGLIGAAIGAGVGFAVGAAAGKIMGCFDKTGPECQQLIKMLLIGGASGGAGIGGKVADVLTTVYP
jgi:hypothetical protein